MIQCRFQRWQLRFAFIVLIAGSVICGSAVCETRPQAVDAKVAGTPTRTEYEYKLAFWVPHDFSMGTLVRAFQKRIHLLVEEQAFQFPQLLANRYRVTKEFQPFLFQDWYFDTPQRQILASESAYRLRYRWSSPSRYKWHQWFPSIPWFYPHRCEIQFKEGYEFDENEGSVTVQETRFEFRDDSPPFDLNRDAPDAPWPRSQYDQFVKNGRFRDYKINAFERMEQIIKASVGEEPVQVAPVLQVDTIRHRIHLDMEHPWGSGPNEQQVFIITIDESKAWDGDSDHQHTRATIPEKSLEIEVEIDRNASTWVRSLAEVDPSQIQGNQDLIAQGVKYTRRAWDALQADGWELRMALRDVLEELLGGEPLPTDFKYRRLTNSLFPPTDENQNPSEG